MPQETPGSGAEPQFIRPQILLKSQLNKARLRRLRDPDGAAGDCIDVLYVAQEFIFDVQTSDKVAILKINHRSAFENVRILLYQFFVLPLYVDRANRNPIGED